jgi:hypothetical protein
MSCRKFVRRGAAYIPAPGSYCETAVDHLICLPPGTEIPTREMAEVLNVNPRGANNYLAAALRNGWIVRRKVGEGQKGSYVWSLGPKAVVVLDRDEGPEEPWPMQRIVPASAAPMQFKPGPASIFDLALETA